MQLTEHFTLAELTISQTAARLGIDNSPDTDALENLRALCTEILEPIRVHFEVAVLVSSGYRGPEVNEAVGGSKRSQHMIGQAVDFTVNTYSVDEMFEWLLSASNLDFDQLIHEFGQWIHVSYRADGRNRGMAMRATRAGGKVRYETIEAGLNV